MTQTNRPQAVQALLAAETMDNLTVLEFSTHIPKKTDNVTYTFEEIAEAYHTFQWDIHWWPGIADNTALDRNPPENAGYLEKWKQTVKMPPTIHVIHILSCDTEGATRRMRTAAVPAGGSRIQMSYLADYIAEDAGDTVKISLVGKLELPALLRGALQLIVKFTGGFAFGRQLKKFYLSGTARNLLDSR